jgi:hypothetical protein
MNVVDSSAWLEYFADGPNAADFAPVIADPENLLVPSITLFEVFKRLPDPCDEPAGGLRLRRYPARREPGGLGDQGRAGGGGGDA